MPSSTLRCKFERLESKALSPDSIKRDYLYGIDLCTIGGEKLSDKAIMQKIEASIARLEIELQIDITPKCRTENLDFERDMYYQWGHMETTRPIRKVTQLKGRLGNLNQLTIPNEWVSTSRESDERNFSRIIRILPIGSSAQYNGVFASGIFIHIGLMSWSEIPNFWEVTYESGFRKIPAEILDIAAKQAVLDIYNIVQDTSLGAGISSQSIGFDGFSQTVSTTASAMYGSLSAKSTQYQKDLEKQLPLLRSHYRGFTFEVL